jgi:hypothetical protein
MHLHAIFHMKRRLLLSLFLPHFPPFLLQKRGRRRGKTQKHTPYMMHNPRREIVSFRLLRDRKRDTTVLVEGGEILRAGAGV